MLGAHASEQGLRGLKRTKVNPRRGGSGLRFFPLRCSRKIEREKDQSIARETERENGKGGGRWNTSPTSSSGLENGSSLGANKCKTLNKV